MQHTQFPTMSLASLHTLIWPNEAQHWFFAAFATIIQPQGTTCFDDDDYDDDDSGRMPRNMPRHAHANGMIALGNGRKMPFATVQLTRFAHSLGPQMQLMCCSLIDCKIH